MSKAIIVAVLFAGLGVGLGYLQASLTNNASEERFSNSRPPMAVLKKEKTTEEILKEAVGRPRLEILGDVEHDFGSMMHGDEMSHAFKFRNVGDGPLMLEMGDSSCTCTVGDLDKSMLQPGEETDVTLTWKALAVTHDFAQYARIKTNDVDQVDVKLAIFGQITAVVSTVPRALKLDNISDSEVTERSIMVYGYAEDITDLQQIAWTNSDTSKLVELEYRKVPVSEISDPDYKNALVAFELKFRIKPGLPLGTLGSRIQFRTNRGDDIGTVEIPVSGRAVGSIELAGGPSFDPSRNLVRMGTVKQSEGAQVSVVLFIQGDNREDVELEVKSVSPEESLEVEIGEGKATPTRIRYPIRLSIPKGAPEVYLPARGPGSFGLVVIKTKGSLDREVRLSVQMKIER